MFPVILQNLRPSGVLFSKDTVCEKFQIAREEVVVTVTTTFKIGGDMLPPSHTKLRLWVHVPPGQQRGTPKGVGNFLASQYIQKFDEFY